MIQTTATEARKPRTALRSSALIPLVGILACSLVSVSQAVERRGVTELRPLMLEALATGKAHGLLVGPGAEAMARRFDADTPIELDVRRIKRLPKAGCGRLQVVTRQRGVLEDGKRRDQELVYEISYCADGRFPEDR